MKQEDGQEGGEMVVKGVVQGILIGLGLILASSFSTRDAFAQQSGPQNQVAKYAELTAKDLEKILGAKDFLFVNVHIPYEGEIKGTDLHVPYNEVEKNLNKFSADKKSKIVVYCRSGSMSAIASRNLARLGYTNVFDVKGGMIAWQKAGFPLGNRQR